MTTPDVGICVLCSEPLDDDSGECIANINERHHGDCAREFCGPCNDADAREQSEEYAREWIES